MEYESEKTGGEGNNALLKEFSCGMYDMNNMQRKQGMWCSMRLNILEVQGTTMQMNFLVNMIHKLMIGRCQESQLWL